MTIAVFILRIAFGGNLGLVAHDDRVFLHCESLLVTIQARFTFSILHFKINALFSSALFSGFAVNSELVSCNTDNPNPLDDVTTVSSIAVVEQVISNKLWETSHLLCSSLENYTHIKQLCLLERIS